MNAFVETLEQYGASRDGLRLFDGDRPELLPYATLVSARDSGNTHGSPDLAALYGVYEWQENPLVFLINGDELIDEAHFRRIRRMVALRGDAPYLGVVRPGQLTIHRLSLDRATEEQSRIPLDSSGWNKRITFSRLANERPDIVASRREWVSDVVLGLLRDAIRSLTGSGICNEDAVSLAGRALFVRFLADRSLLLLPLAPGGETDSACFFDDRYRAKTTSQWLDETFNGDFLPLTPEIFEQLSSDNYKTLGDIGRRAKGGQLYLGWEHKWDYLDFAHIPVGVLSQAYEQYMREHLPEKQRKEGGYYTPRTIVELMVRGAFHALRHDGTAHQARVLDPAAGAGVFLIAAFRQIVRERWVHDGSRPDTSVLRHILYHQIVGFDINEEALRFAALGLYLISIELDPCPQPVEKLRFEKNLRGSVLHKVADDNENSDKGKPSRSLGSLGPIVGFEHVGQYDLVIGNPPWPTGTKLPNWSEVKKIVSRIAKNRVSTGASAPPLPNECLDLPFVWRAMEWGKLDGQIAFALHARLLFQQGDGMPEARRAIFDALDVTGILNGAEICETQVWPGISAPFCVLFAINRLPPLGSCFRFVSPHVEALLNRTSTLRVDASNAEMVTAQQVAQRPEILKILFRGTSLDLEVFERMVSSGLKTLKIYWKELFGEYRGHLKQAGNGYKRLRESLEKPRSTDHLIGLPEWVGNDDLPLLIDTINLPLFKQPFLYRPRSREIYKGPLLIIHQSPPAGLGRIRVAVADNDLVFNETYYGYSAWSYTSAHRLVRYLALLIGSRPALWYLLMTSGKFGVERRVVEKIIIDSMPVVPFEDIGTSSREQVDLLFEALVYEDSEENWERVDAWVAGLFGLRKRDLQVIADTLKYNLPFARNRETAQAQPSREEIKTFCLTLASELQPWAQRLNADIKVEPVKLPALSPWEVVHIQKNINQSSISGGSQQFSGDWPQVLQIADQLGTTEVLMPDQTNNGLWVARLRQARYWSQSQARLVARRIVWEHMDAVFGRSKAS